MPTTCIDTPWKAEVADLFAKIGFDGATYLVDANTLPADHEYGAGGNWLGVAGPLLDLSLESHLRSQGLWGGRRRAILLAIDKIDAMLGEYARQKTLAVAVHELCHHLADADPAWLLDLDQMPAERAEQARRHVADRPGPAPLRTAENVRTHHGSTWLRAIAHASFRAVHTDAGSLLSPAIVAAENAGTGPQWPLAPIRQYIQALGDEPRRLASLPIVEALACPPPESFTRFAEADLQRALAELGAAAKQEPPRPLTLNSFPGIVI